MKHLFIPYKLALMLKKKGFDEPCMSYYFPDGGFMEAAEEDDTRFPGDLRFYEYSNSEGENIAAPLYQQIVEWFYNKHRMFVEADGYIINSGEHDGCYGFKATIRIAENYKEKILFAQGEFPTREKAWNKAIEEAIKLI